MTRRWTGSPRARPPCTSSSSPAPPTRPAIYDFAPDKMRAEVARARAAIGERFFGAARRVGARHLVPSGPRLLPRRPRVRAELRRQHLLRHRRAGGADRRASARAAADARLRPRSSPGRDVARRQSRRRTASGPSPPANRTPTSAPISSPTAAPAAPGARRAPRRAAGAGRAGRRKRLSVLPARLLPVRGHDGGPEVRRSSSA